MIQARVDRAEEKIKKLRAKVAMHEYNYRILSEPIISDNRYDILYNQLKALEDRYPQFITPDSPTRQVGSDRGAKPLL